MPENTTAQINPKLFPLIEKLRFIQNTDSYNEGASFIRLPFDERIIQEVYDLKKQLESPKIKYFVLIGIGGSNLGTKAVYEALLSKNDSTPKIIFLDNPNAKAIEKIRENVTDPEEWIINAVSKSGKTTESVFNLEYLLNRVPSLKPRLVVTTDFNSDWFRETEYKQGLKLGIPSKVSGRYSVLSAVGLFPLAMAGFNILHLLEGAMEATHHSLQRENNFAAERASYIFSNLTSGKSIYENIYFSEYLETLGKWHRQILAESLGKNGKGLTPTVSIGSIDMHSQTQLHFAGPHDKQFNFIKIENEEEFNSIQNIYFQSFPEMLNKSQRHVKVAIYESVKKTYEDNSFPVTETIIPSLDERSLGYFMQTKMIETVFLAELLEVNPFDQPNIEDYKIYTRKILEAL